MILMIGDRGSELRSWGVMKMNWRLSMRVAISTSSCMATFRETWSMKTSNSSMMRKGHSIVLPSDTSMASVEKDRSPPDSSWMLSICDRSSWLSLRKETPSSLSSCSKRRKPEEPFMFMMRSNSLLLWRQMKARMRLRRLKRSFASFLRSSPSFSICLQPDSFSANASLARIAFCSATPTSTSLPPRRSRAFALHALVWSILDMTSAVLL
mmetsp:Transcript_4724/g.14014  ORF Transcript_4724/g.14014 Transcript_4724/m.14014 type:complete len:210 (-) Transcript_4724:456-1085(-)